MWSDEILKTFSIYLAGNGENGDSGDSGEDSGKPGEGDSGKDNQSNGNQGDDDPGESDDDKLDFDSLSDKTKKYIKKLRDENKQRRTEFNNLSSKMERFELGFKKMFGDDDNVNPEEALEALKGNHEVAVSENAILRLAIENGISGHENLEYFEFLVAKRLNSLEEGEEMGEEDLGEIISKCKKGAAGPANTSTNETGKGGKQDPGKSNGQVTQEEFNKMTIIQKSNLYQKNPALYESLMKNAKL